MARSAATRSQRLYGSQASASDTTTETAAAARCGRLRRLGPTRARKVIGTAKSSASPSGIAPPATAPSQVAAYHGAQTGTLTPK